MTNFLALDGGTATSTYRPWPNQKLIDELDTKYLRVDKILRGFLIKRFYNQEALRRLRKFHSTLWWREIRKNEILELSTFQERGE